MALSTKEMKIYALTEEIRGINRTISIYEGWKKGYENFNSQLGNYSMTIEKALDNIFAAKQNYQSGGFISGDDILGNDLIPNIDTNLKNAKNSVSSINSFCLRKMDEFNKRINECNISLSIKQNELYKLKNS